MAYSFQIPVRPQVKQRHRWGAYGTYTPRKTQSFEKTLKSYFKAVKKPLECGISLEIVFYFKKPKKPSRDYPSKGDLDNYIKAVLDGMNKIVFKDDSQVTKISASKEWGEEDLILVKVTKNSEAL